MADEQGPTPNEGNGGSDAPQAGPLREALVTHDHRLVYRIDDGIPVLLVEEGSLKDARKNGSIWLRPI